MNTLHKNELARVSYACKTDNGKSFTLTASLYKSSGFDYGNGHIISITEDAQYGYNYGLDARYDSRFDTCDTFYTYILDVLKERYNIATYEQIEKL